MNATGLSAGRYPESTLVRGTLESVAGETGVLPAIWGFYAECRICGRREASCAKGDVRMP